MDDSANELLCFLVWPLQVRGVDIWRDGEGGDEGRIHERMAKRRKTGTMKGMVGIDMERWRERGRGTEVDKKFDAN